MNLIEWLKSFFKRDLRSLQKESESIVSVFKETVENLKKVNAEVAIQQMEKVKVILALQKEIDTLTALAEANNRIAANVQSILS